jgi:antitoxin component YwqK of YwqJK toxin-antitoxin module
MLRILSVLPMRLSRPSLLLLLGLFLLAGACSRKTVSFNSKPAATGLGAVSDSLTTTAADTAQGPSLVAKRVSLTKEQERAAKEKEKAAQRKPKKKKNIFLGERIKKGYVKSGGKGKNQVIETFYYLRTFQQPNPYAPARYAYDPKKHRIFKANGEIDPNQYKVLHGSYKKMQGGKVIETGYYAIGTRHLRWETFNRDNILLNKRHYEMGFPRDANVTYYDAAQKQVKEVIPFVNGKLEGEYARYNENGQIEWDGQFENGKRVGTWNRYWGFRNTRNRLRYEYQYGETGYDPEVTEPVLVKEYNRNGVLIYEKDKLDKRGEPDTARPGMKK